MLQAGIEPVPGFSLSYRLGAGAFAEVWAASTADGQTVALKFIDTRGLDPGLLRSEVRVLRCLRELQHPNLIRLLDVHVNSRFLILSMEQAEGNLEELRQAYREETKGDIPPEHLLELLDQAAEGLDYFAGLRLPGFNLASEGMQHCDVKPSNLLLLGNTVKVADFGLCAGMNQRTHIRGVRGTPLYAAPEQFRGRITNRSDQYALAVTWCDLVGGDRLNRKVTRNANICLPPVDLMYARTSEATVLARALHEDSTRRWPSCRDFVAALRDAVLNPLRRSVKSRRPIHHRDRPQVTARAAAMIDRQR